MQNKYICTQDKHSYMHRVCPMKEVLWKIVYSFTLLLAYLYLEKSTYSISSRSIEGHRPRGWRPHLTAPPSQIPGGLKRWVGGGGRYGATSWPGFSTKPVTSRGPANQSSGVPSGSHPITVAHSYAAGSWTGTQSRLNSGWGARLIYLIIHFFLLTSSGGLEKRPLSFSEQSW